jgi:hypothetical protein
MQSLGIHTTAFTPVRKAVLKPESDWTAMKADTTASNCLIVNQDSIAIEKLLDGYFPTQWTLAQNRAVGKGVNAAGEAAFYCVDYYNTSFGSGPLEVARLLSDFRRYLVYYRKPPPAAGELAVRVPPSRTGLRQLDVSTRACQHPQA